MTTLDPVYISLEFTPNPNTLKYTVNRELCSQGSVSFTQEAKEEAQRISPLSHLLLEIEGISAVMLGKDFVTITKTEEAEWDHVHKNASTQLQKFLEKGEPAVLSPQNTPEVYTGEDSELIFQIKKMIDEEVRPAVARDGGDIQFNKFESGIVYVALSGACSGCPSSQATLKMGIENRLKELFPEVEEVVSI